MLASVTLRWAHRGLLALVLAGGVTMAFAANRPAGNVGNLANPASSARPAGAANPGNATANPANVAANPANIAAPAVADAPAGAAAAQPAAAAPDVSPVADQPPPPESAECKDCKSGELKARREVQTWVVGGAMVILLLVTIGFFWYLWTLREHLATLAGKYEDSRKNFLQMALGVPDGTIRSALAVLIVLGALLSLIAAMGAELGFEVPDALTGVFGTILGFYFGRAGSVETSKATEAMADAAQISSQASKDVAAANETKEAAQRTVAAAEESVAVSSQALASAQESRFKAVASRVDPISRALDTIVDFAPPDLLGDSGTKWIQLRDGINAAINSRSLDQLQATLDRLGKEGPVAALLQRLSPALAPMAQSGQTAADVARALIEFHVTLAPEVAQRWALRVLGLPFRAELLDPVIDDAFATALIKVSPIATRIVESVRVGDDNAPISATHLVSSVLTDDAVATLTEELDGKVSPEDIATMVEQLQKRAVEQQLERDIPAEKFAVFGGIKALFDALDRVRATDEGQQALDVLLGIVRRARSIGVSIADLLSPEH